MPSGNSFLRSSRRTKDGNGWKAKWWYTDGLGPARTGGVSKLQETEGRGNFIKYFNTLEINLAEHAAVNL